MSELDYGDGFGAEYDAPAADFTTEADDAGFDYAPEPLDPAVVDETTRAGLAEIEGAVADFQRATGSWKPSKDEWDAAMAQLEQRPDWHQHVSQTQALNRAQAHVETFVESLPEGERARALALAEQYAEAAQARYGGDPTLGQAALIAGAQHAQQEAQQVSAFSQAVHAAAKAVGADPAKLDIADVYKRATKAMPAVAEALPGMSAEQVAMRSIIGAVRAVGGRNIERPLSDDYALADRLVSDLRGPQPQPTSSFDYRSNRTATAANVASGRIPRKD